MFGKLKEIKNRWENELFAIYGGDNGFIIENISE